MKIKMVLRLFLIIVFASSLLPISGLAFAISPAAVTIDGAVSSDTADGVSSISFTHTAGTGDNRLMLVGVSSNSYNGARTISSVVFDDGTDDYSMVEVGTIENESGRLAAIYGLVNPPYGASPGTVTVTFSGIVNYGIIAGAINFAGVDQLNPLGTFASNTGQSDAPTVTLEGLAGNEVVFDTAFIGAATIPSATVGAGQSERWNDSIDRAGGLASTKQAMASSETMNWSTVSSVYWAVAAVPINPLSETYYTLTMNVDPTGGGTTTPSVGAYNGSDGITVDITATPEPGYDFVLWSGDVADPGLASTTVTMDDNKTVTACFAESSTGGSVTLDGTVSSGTDTGVSSISFAHTTGIGSNRLTLVGTSWNSGTAATLISSVTFTPDGGGDPTLFDEVGTAAYSSNNRYASIYRWPEGSQPPVGQLGMISIAFNATIDNGIVAGAANFAGVNQATPLGAFTSDEGTGTAPTLDVTGLSGNELVFDVLFGGGPTTLTVGAGQDELWDDNVGNATGGSSTEQATGSSVTMSWTKGNTNLWIQGAVPINPATLEAVPHTWYLSNPTMYQEDVSQLEGFSLVPAGSSVIWKSDLFTENGYTFNNGDWTGQITLLQTLESGQSFNVTIGSSTGGENFNAFAGGLQTMNGDGATRVFFINDIDAVTFSVPEGQYLALKIEHPGGYDPFHVRIGSAYSFVSAPIGDPAFPLVEITSGILMGLGLASLGITIWYRKRKKAVAESTVK